MYFKGKNASIQSVFGDGNLHVGLVKLVNSFSNRVAAMLHYFNCKYS